MNVKTNNNMKVTLISLAAAVMTAVSAMAQKNVCDVNYDNEVNSADVVAIYNNIINGDVPQRPALQREDFVADGVTFTMMPVDGGSFMMGATIEQTDAYDDESPTHLVTLGDYLMGCTEVTQELWEAVMGSNPSATKGDMLPVTNVSWDYCQEFISRLNARFASQLDGRTFRLPTEAEWEFAARGGNRRVGYMYSGSNTLDDVAWYSNNSDRMIHEVGGKAANELGIYDLSGGVWEWCQDWFGDYSSDPQTDPVGPPTGSNRVIRGGSWDFFAIRCRTSYRSYYDPAYANGRPNLGLRLVLSR